MFEEVKRAIWNEARGLVSALHFGSRLIQLWSGSSYRNVGAEDGCQMRDAWLCRNLWCSERENSIGFKKTIWEGRGCIRVAQG